MIQLKRAYDPVSPDDGKRVLVDRLWPRGVSKVRAHLTEWMKDIGPSTELRKWFGHDPAKWKEFQNRYKRELKSKTDLLRQLKDLSEEGTVTLIYGTRDREHNEAQVLKEVLEKMPST